MSLTIKTGRLELIAETAELAAANAAGKAELARALGADVPPDWPPETAADAMAPFAAQLEREPELAGWLGWYWVLVGPAFTDKPSGPAPDRRTLIGYGGFTSPPVDGVVAIGYSVLPGYRGKGYATEAVKALVEWACSHPEVRKVIAETVPDNVPSARVLERAGFRRAGKASEPGHIRYQLNRLD